MSNLLCIHGYEGAWNANTGNGYYGGLQFDLRTWAAVGGSGLPSDASPAEQLARGAALVRLNGGYSAWPNTGPMCGVR